VTSPSIPRRLAALAAVSALAFALSAAPALADTRGDGHGDGHNLTCAGGSIAPGTYDNVTVTGFCTVDSGSITVRHDLVVKSGAALIALFGGSDFTVRSDVTVKHDIEVEKNGVLALGCGSPSDSTCLDDPGNQTVRATGSVGHDLTADGALAVIVHNTSIGHDLDQHGGGGGLNCDLVMLGSPAYSTYESSTIGGSVSITGLQTCWLGFLGNKVGHNVTFNNNRTVNVSETTGKPDGNEIAGNQIRGNLSCKRNDPAPQMGDTGFGPNTIRGHATGQCAGLKS
jgi:hypothetical protein